MLSITLICVGKMKEKFYMEAAAEYVKRLGAYCKLNVVELPEQKLPQDPSRGRSTPPWQRRPRPSGEKFRPMPAWSPCASRESCTPARSWRR